MDWVQQWTAFWFRKTRHRSSKFTENAEWKAHIWHIFIIACSIARKKTNFSLFSNSKFVIFGLFWLFQKWSFQCRKLKSETVLRLYPKKPREKNLKKCQSESGFWISVFGQWGTGLSQTSKTVFDKDGRWSKEEKSTKQHRTWKAENLCWIENKPRPWCIFRKHHFSLLNKHICAVGNIAKSPIVSFKSLTIVSCTAGCSSIMFFLTPPNKHNFSLPSNLISLSCHCRCDASHFSSNQAAIKLLKLFSQPALADHLLVW